MFTLCVLSDPLQEDAICPCRRPAAGYLTTSNEEEKREDVNMEVAVSTSTCRKWMYHTSSTSSSPSMHGNEKPRSRVPEAPSPEHFHFAPVVMSGSAAGRWRLFWRNVNVNESSSQFSCWVTCTVCLSCMCWRRSRSVIVWAWKGICSSCMSDTSLYWGLMKDLQRNTLYLCFIFDLHVHVVYLLWVMSRWSSRWRTRWTHGTFSFSCLRIKKLRKWLIYLK